MRALVTGSAGFAGRHLCELLRTAAVQPVGFDLVDGNDVRDYEQVRAAVDQVQPDLVFHLAAQAYVAESNADPLRAFEVNCQGTLHVLEAVRRVGQLGCRVLIAGSSEEYGWHQREQPIDETDRPAPTTIYGASKACASIAALAYGEHHSMPVVVTRATNHTGPGQSAVYALSSFARRLALIDAGQLDVLEHGDLSAYRDFLDVRDVVRAYRHAIMAAPGVYNVTSGHPAERMQTILDLLCEQAGMSPAPLKLNESAHQRQRSYPFVMSYRKLLDATGWAPQIPLWQTLLDLFGYWKGRVT